MDSSDIAALVCRAASGDERAWEELVELYTGLLWSVARAHRLDEQTAAEVVQTAWLRLLENLDRLQDPSRVGAWLATTARHECLRLIRRASRERPTPEDSLERIDACTPAVDAGLLAEERDAALWRAMQQLSEPCRALLRLLAATPPLSYIDVAAALDRPVGSIGPTRERCLRRLRSHLQGEGML